MIKKGTKLWGKRPEINNWLVKFQFKKGHKSKKPIKKGEHRGIKTEFKKGLIPWSKKNKGKYHLWENRQNPMTGKIPWNKDKNHSKYKEFIKIATRIGKSNKNKLKGEKNPNWREGKSFEPYGLDFNRRLKEQIRKRDNYRCQECFRHQNELGYKLIVHHIDFDKRNNVPTNLISLCRNCHGQTQFNREDWTNYFQERVNGFD